METPAPRRLANKLIAETNHFLAAQQEYMARRIEASLRRKASKKERQDKKEKERRKERASLRRA